MLRFRTPIVMALTAATLGACAAPQPTLWDKPGATQSDFNRDKYECAKDGITAGGTQYLGYGVTQRTFNLPMAKMCMVARGYNERPANAPMKSDTQNGWGK